MAEKALDLSPSMTPRVVGHVVKTSSNSSIRHIEFSPIVTSDSEVSGMNPIRGDNYKPTPPTNNLSNSSELNTTKCAGERFDLNLKGNTVEDYAKNTDMYNSFIHFNPEDSKTKSSMNEFPASIFQQTVSQDGVFRAKAGIVSEDSPPKATPRVSSRRVLQMPQFELSSHSSFEGSSSPTNDSWSNNFESLKPHNNIKDVNRTTFEDVFRKERSLTTGVSSIEFIDISHRDWAGVGFRETFNSEIEIKSSSSLASPDITKLDEISGDFSALSPSNEHVKSLLSEESNKFTINHGDTDLTKLMFHGDAINPSTDHGHLIKEKHIISTTKTNDYQDRSCVSTVEAEDGKTSPLINIGDVDSTRLIYSKNSTNIYEDHGYVLTEKPIISTTETVDYQHRSSVFIVEVEDEKISPPSNLSIVDELDESNHPIVTEEYYKEFSPKTSSVTIVELENDDDPQPGNHDDDIFANIDSRTCKPQCTEGAVLGLNVETDARPVPTPREEEKFAAGLDETFVDWLEDRGFKVVDEARIADDKSLSDRKKRLSWEFVFEDEQELLDLNDHTEISNIPSSTNRGIIDDFETATPTNSESVEQNYDIPSNNEHVNQLSEPNFSKKDWNDLLLTDVSNQFPAVDNEGRHISSEEKQFEFSGINKEHNVSVAQKMVETEEFSLKNEKEFISLSLVNVMEKEEYLDVSDDDVNRTDRIDNHSIITDSMNLENGDSLEEQKTPKLMIEDPLRATTQTSLITPRIGPNVQDCFGYQEAFTDEEKDKEIHNGHTSSEGHTNLYKTDNKADTLTPSFILDAYENESSFSQNYDSSLTIMELEKYPEAPWLSLLSESLEDVGTEGAISKVTFSSFADDLHSVPLYEENASFSNDIEVSGVQAGNAHPSSLSVREIEYEGGRKEWNTTETDRLTHFEDEDVYKEESVDTIRRKIEEARRSSCSSSSKGSVRERDEIPTQIVEEDSVFLKANNDMEDIHNQNIVPTPPPRPSLSSERSNKVHDIVATETTYIETNLDTSWTSAEGDPFQKPITTQFSSLVYEDVDFSVKLNNNKSKENEPQTLSVQHNTDKPHESAVEIPQELVCTCPKISRFSSLDWKKRLEEEEDIDVIPGLIERDENVIDTEPKIAARPSSAHQDEIPAEQSSEDAGRNELPNYILGPKRTIVTCPHCKSTVVTEIVKKPSLAFAWCIFPIFVDSMKKVEHWCPGCRCLIGRYSWKPFQKNV